MLRLTTWAATALLACVLWARPEPACAQERGPATRFLEQRHEQVNRLLRAEASTDRARQERQERLAGIINTLLDYRELARRALGAHWDERGEAERTQFVDLLRRLVERNYESNLERTLEFEVTYRGETARDGETIVETEARSRTQRRQPPVEIRYSMRRSGEGWAVHDVTTDGVSLVRNYRDQFHRIIARDGWAELIARMERRLATEAGDDT